jgi:hypothetical protein
VTRSGPHSRRSRRGALVLGAALLSSATLAAPPARAFPHVVRQGETLAKLAERVYGLIEHERVLVAANALDAGGGTSIVKGMRLEIPALSHYRVQAGDTWSTLAEALLGDADRQDVLSIAYDSSPWLTPAEGAEIVVPYNLRVLVGPGDNVVTIAARFMGSREKGWVLDRYNRLKGTPPRRGDLLLVPLVNLKLTEAGKAEALAAGALERSQAGGGAREAQRRVDAELPSLLGEVRSGRYIDAVTRGARLLTYGELSRPQLALLHRQLLEAYVALDARGHASAACRAWRESDPEAQLDATYLSPKIMAACEVSSAAPLPTFARSAAPAPSSPPPPSSPPAGAGR